MQLCSGVTKGTADRPGWHPLGGDTRMDKSFVAEFRKNSRKKEVGEVKNVRGDTLYRMTPEWNQLMIREMSKKGRQYFEEKMGVTL